MAAVLGRFPPRRGIGGSSYTQPDVAGVDLEPPADLPPVLTPRDTRRVMALSLQAIGHFFLAGPDRHELVLPAHPDRRFLLVAKCHGLSPFRCPWVLVVS